MLRRSKDTLGRIIVTQLSFVEELQCSCVSICRKSRIPLTPGDVVHDIDQSRMFWFFDVRWFESLVFLCVLSIVGMC